MRYVVRAIDNCGTLDPPPPRDRTWVVFDRGVAALDGDGGQDPGQVAEYDTRRQAREEARRLNQGGAVGHGRKATHG